MHVEQNLSYKQRYLNNQTFGSEQVRKKRFLNLNNLRAGEDLKRSRIFVFFPNNLIPSDIAKHYKEVLYVSQRSIIKFEPLYIPAGFQCNF